MRTISQPLPSAFLSAARRFPDRPALEVEGRVLSYRQLEQGALAVAATLQRRHLASQGPRMAAIVGARTAATYTGILGALLAGHAYVPLSPTFPATRLRLMLERSGAAVLLVDPASTSTATGIVGAGPGGAQVVSLGAADLDPPSAWTDPGSTPENLAYLLFTSGSTGEPKGVAISQASVLCYLDVVRSRLGVTEHDRFSQIFDLGFDLSVSDLFLPWTSGACLCVPSAAELRKPDRYIRDSRLTIWFSTPSLAAMMQRLGVLKPGMYPGLRASLFCGEALPVEIARAWAHACPGSILENLYGPTEATIACTAHRWDERRSPEQAENGIVAIGEPFPGMQAIVVNDALRELPDGEAGDLLLSGGQVAPGYWKDPERTAASFVTPPGRGEEWYRTGDRARRLPGGTLVYLGRMDQQIKIRGGFRVELGEIETVARRQAGVRAAAAVGWPATARGAEGIELFVEGEALDPAAVRAALAALLPPHMVPRAVHVLPSLPVNARGKCDRLALFGMLQQSG